MLVIDKKKKNHKRQTNPPSGKSFGENETSGMVSTLGGGGKIKKGNFGNPDAQEFVTSRRSGEGQKNQYGIMTPFGAKQLTLCIKNV